MGVVACMCRCRSLPGRVLTGSPAFSLPYLLGAQACMHAHLGIFAAKQQKYICSFSILFPTMSRRLLLALVSAAVKLSFFLKKIGCKTFDSQRSRKRTGPSTK